MPYITEKNEEQILQFAQTLHCNPELSGQEVQTTKLIKELLTNMNIELMDIHSETGVIGVIRGAYPGRTVALRADIDALPVQEDRSHKICSKKDGVMHACGHDIHTAALLGAAFTLQNLRQDLHGNVLLIFQPAEEISTGAKMIVESGVFDEIKPDAFFSVHIMPGIPSDKLGVRSGSIMAAQMGFKITVFGKGGHGSAPQNAHDPIIASARTVDALQSIVARENDPLSPFVLSVCSIHGGSAINVIPDEVTLSGTCRFLENNRVESIKERIEKISSITAEVHQCRAETEFFRFLPALVNSSELVFVAQDAGTVVFGKENITQQNSVMASEDFALFGQIAPVFMYHVGVGGEYPLHNSHLHISEQTAVQCAELLTQTALKYLDIK